MMFFYCGAQAVRTEWVRQWPAMVIIAVNSIMWSAAVEEAIVGGSVPAFLETSVNELMDLTDLVRGQLTNQERNTMGALITIDVHARDVVQVGGGASLYCASFVYVLYTCLMIP
jgi:dynein heavy chain